MKHRHLRQQVAGWYFAIEPLIHFLYPFLDAFLFKVMFVRICSLGKPVVLSQFCFKDNINSRRHL